jgi:hypothetical protein
MRHRQLATEKKARRCPTETGRLAETKRQS